ncbi:MAG: addiction module protein [Gemmatimonadetes bacterium]|nr:addiction module protein [Gemmatimonadota bacterium]
MVEEEAHRRAMESGGEADELIAELRARREADVEAAWAEEAHRRWKAYQRGEEEMLDFDDVMAGIRATFPR